MNSEKVTETPPKQPQLVGRGLDLGLKRCRLCETNPEIPEVPLHSLAFYILRWRSVCHDRRRSIIIIIIIVKTNPGG